MEDAEKQMVQEMTKYTNIAQISQEHQNNQESDQQPDLIGMSPEKENESDLLGIEAKNDQLPVADLSNLLDMDMQQDQD